MKTTQSGLGFLASVLLAACSAAGGTTSAGSTEDEVQADACETVPADGLAESSRAFLFAEGLAGPYDELEIGGGMRTRWLPVSAVRAPADRESAPGTCLLRMNLVIETTSRGGETQTSPSDQWEVIAFDAETKALQRFEQAIAVAERIVVALGNRSSSPGQAPRR